MNLTSTPKVFISYSWSSSVRVEELAKRLLRDGIDVVLDKWNLTAGQDKYVFMEQCVTDKEINKVLIICDKDYAEKANKREGGVGDETVIISAEVYGKVTQEKFIPIIFEKDDAGKECCPEYLKSRIYIDLTDSEQFETNYEKLLRNLYNKPENSKPTLGKMPEWLNGEYVDFWDIRNLLKQIQDYNGSNPAGIKFTTRQFEKKYAIALNVFADIVRVDYAVKLWPQIDAMKPLRDLFLEYIEALLFNGISVADILGDFFESVYNATINCQDRTSYSERDFDFARFSIWELLICTTAVLIQHDKYAEIFDLLNRTYFLKEDAFSSSTIKPQTYMKFCWTARLLETAGYILTKREQLPLIGKNTLANADVVLCQLARVFAVSHPNVDYYWFSHLYIYSERYLDTEAKQEIWSKMISKRYCDKIMPLFGITTLQELRDIVKTDKPPEQNMGPYYGSSVPDIKDSIEPEQIGTMP
jgi:hypothetical protein